VAEKVHITYSTGELKKIRSRIIEVLEAAAPEWFPRAEFYKKVRPGRGAVKKDVLDAVLTSLIQSGQVEEKLIPNKNRNARPKHTYRFVINLEDEDTPLPPELMAHETAELSPQAPKTAEDLVMPMGKVFKELLSIGQDSNIPSKDRVEALKQAGDVHHRSIKILQSIGVVPNADRRVQSDKTTGPLIITDPNGHWDPKGLLKAVAEEAEYRKKDDEELRHPSKKTLDTEVEA